MGYWKTTRLIILPQALKLVIPGIVNTFIGLFKDTTLVLIVGLFDLLGIVQFHFTDASWATPETHITGMFLPEPCSGRSALPCPDIQFLWKTGCRQADDEMTQSDEIISIQNLNKWFGNFHVLRDINLSVRSGEKIVICGPSGSGKSTLIRASTGWKCIRKATLSSMACARRLTEKP